MTLFGYGNTNKALAKNGGCRIYDDKFTEAGSDEYGNALLPASEFVAQDDFEVVTPGIPPHNALILKAKNPISDYDYFADAMPFSVWISGTNGKTTTTEMCEFLLRERRAVAGGNIGKAVGELERDAKIWILETSSFTLHYTNKARPGIYILLPITQDHIYWHGSFEAYEAAKLKPFATMREGDLIIAPKKYENIPSLAKVIGYESSDDLARFFGIEKERVRFKEPFLTDAMLALAVSRVLFDTVDYERINSFKVDAHKMEEFSDAKGRMWVDDSKATNVDATLQALKAYGDKKLLLILGGDDKGADLEPLFDALEGLDVKLFLIGKNAQRLEELSMARELEYCLCFTLQSAVIEMDKYLEGESTAMLSPAAASLDQFSGYRDRGTKFKAYVANLS